MFVFQESSSLQTVIIDLTIYAITFTLSLVGLLITDGYVKKYPKLLTVASVTALVILFINNFLVPFYHGLTEPEENLRPAYTTHIIITCYIFLNVKHTLVALMLGLVVTAGHVAIEYFVTYRNKDMLFERVSNYVHKMFNSKNRFCYNNCCTEKKTMIILEVPLLILPYRSVRMFYILSA